VRWPWSKNIWEFRPRGASNMYDVAVVGAGPAGSWTACKLAELGYAVVVLEKHESIGQKFCCTGILSQECVTRYSIPETLILHKANGASVFSPSGQPVRLWRPEPQACIVNRPDFDRFLAMKALQAGAEYRLSSRAESITIEKKGAVVKVDQAGRPVEIRSRAVVLACGFASPLVKKLGLGMPGDFVTGVQAEVSTPIEEVEVYFGQNTAPGFFAWLVPTSTGRGLVGLLTRRNSGFYLKRLISDLQFRGKISSVLSRLRYGGVPIGLLKNSFGDRLVLVGDAAGQVKPTTGGGIYFGLLSSEIAVDTLNSALRSEDLSAKNLSTYECRWRRLLGHELRLEGYARRLYEGLSDKMVDRLFKSLSSPGIVESLLADNSLSFDWHGGLMRKALKFGVASQASKLLGSAFSSAKNRH
jgi:digeranylgeranylglycerophospholipid reductase